MAATIKDVAAAAGVGIATVSRVFSGNGPVGAATRERVLAAARALDYRPSAAARSLKTRGAAGIGLVLPGLDDPFAAELAEGVLAGARDHGEHVLLDVSGGDPAREAAAAARFAEQRVDGIVAVPAAATPADAAAWADVARACGVVFADRVLPGAAGIPSVLADDAAGVRVLVEYLAGLGHRRVAFLGAAAPGAAPGVRERAFRAALREAGADERDAVAVPARPNRDSAYAAAAGLLQSRADVTAVVASGHLLGEAAVLVARELDLRVPGDVSIAMVDDVPWAELCDPPLTAVARPARLMGQRACDLLLRDRARRPAAPAPLPAELVVRGSCGPPRQARGPR
ncbi:LacI family DNA-binding transcriptional regulator [Actinomadura atramentaria]|uniref:LacI family DNA-binding transcriptional regulator n=1 Tax=Actinomadura atramentaria TaxID=1990 RepID=UPI00035C43DA|nr:LacI family DNA-binding transcriptional regulator [Actinomadura atramentaria]